MQLVVLKVPQTAFGTYGFSASNNQGSDYDESTLVKVTAQSASTKPPPGPSSGKGKGAGVRNGIAMTTVVLATLASLRALV